MTTPQERDEFRRMQVVAELEHDRLIVHQYEEGLTFYRQRIESGLYDLGKLDERLGGDTRES